MRYGVLGPLEVRDGERPIEVRGAKQRALLAVLLLHANRVVSTDRLIDALWQDDPPETAAKALQVYVSQLRKLLGRERLLTLPPGYALRVEPGELDAERFERLAAERHFDEALGLWRGPPLQEFAASGFADGATTRLEELRLVCLEQRLEADLEAGRAAELVGELDALVAEHPLRERLRALQMLALYRSGRQAEALEAYQAARRTLVEELGIEPGRRLRELHRRLLEQDPALEPVAPAPEPSRASPFLEPARASPALASGEPGPESRKTVTVLCAAVELGAVEGRGLDPEALRRAQWPVLAEMHAAVERHGGSIVSAGAEAVTAVFGIPAVHEDDALRALRAAAELAAAVRRLGDELLETQRVALELRLGLSTGEVLAGGAAQPTGEPLTTASRLAQGAQPGAIVFDEATHRLVRGGVVAEQHEGAMRLLELAPARHAGGFRSPMVGRRRERRRLQDAFEQAAGDRSCQLFTVLGPAGVGKSRLVEEFLADVAGAARVVRGRCLPYGEGITYWPVMEVVKEAVGLDDADSPDDALAKLRGALRDEPDAELVARRVSELVGLAEASRPAEAAFAAVRALLETVARARPLVVVFDDVHWGEPTFLDLLEHLADWTRDVAILLVCLARQELLDVRPGWGGGKLNATSILLEPLSESESVELVGNLAGASLDADTRQRVVAAAEGNPLFVEEMLALVVEQGGGDVLEVPATIQALLAARLDRLGADERAVIERAAVVGKVFYEGAVAELAPPPLRDAVPDLLRSLVRKELVRADRASLGERTYRFRHLLIRDAAYDAIPKEGRAELHERFGRWLDAAAGERATEYDEVVGYHLEQAHRYRSELGPLGERERGLGREAAARLGAAGRRAFVRSDAPAAMKLISRAVALLPPDDALRVELVPNVRAMQGMAGDTSFADRVLTEAVEAAATSGDRRLAAHALVQRGLLRLFTDAQITPPELFDVGERSIAVFEELRDELGLARAWRLMAQAHYLDRSGRRSAAASERALVHARRAGERFEETEIVTWLSVALALGSTPAPEAAERCRELLADAAGDPVLAVPLLGVTGYVEAMQDRLAEAEALFARGRELMDELGEVIWLYWLWALLADPLSGVRELEWATELLERIGDRSHFSSTAAVLARATCAVGRYDEAERLSREAERASRANDVHGQISWRSTRAKVLAQRGEFGQAEALAREAVAFADRSDFLNAHGDALMDLAQVLCLAGRPEDALPAAERAIALYGEKGNLVLARRARAERERLLERARGASSLR